MEQNERITITICGDGGCGKSSITLRLVRGQWTHEYDPTIEDSYSVSRTVDGRPYYLSLTDTAGQEEYRSLWASSNLKSDAFLLVYDITQHDSLEKLEHFSTMIEHEAEIREMNGQVPPVKIVAGNKSDLAAFRAVTSKEGLDWAKSRGCGFMETSAREKVNIEETFALLVRRTVEQRQLRSNGGFALPARARPKYSTTPTPTLNEKSRMDFDREVQANGAGASPFVANGGGGAAAGGLIPSRWSARSRPRWRTWASRLKYWGLCGCARKPRGGTFAL